MKLDEISEPCSAAFRADELCLTDNLSAYPSSASQPSEILLRLARRIAGLPLASQKVLAMYYHENLSISKIAAYFEMPGWRIDQILAQSVAFLRNDL